MAEGWIKLHRSIQEHWIWKGEPFDKRSAWIDLLMLANHEDKKVLFNGRLKTCKRGTVNRSITSLAERWKWSRKKVTNFLKILEQDKMVIIKSTTEGTTLTIANYGKFQLKGTTEDTTEEATQEQRENINKNVKNDKEYIKPTKNQFNVFTKQDYDFAALEETISN